jgi:hypothetical protein
VENTQESVGIIELNKILTNEKNVFIFYDVAVGPSGRCAVRWF